MHGRWVIAWLLPQQPIALTYASVLPGDPTGSSAIHAPAMTGLHGTSLWCPRNEKPAIGRVS
jgi:hypothetical protein